MAATGAFPGAHALLVAIANYRTVRNLPEAVINDADDIATVLQSSERCGYDPAKVRILRDAKATKDAILAELDRLAAVAGPNDSVCIYFSGHGWRADHAEESFLLPVDVARADLTGTAIAASTFSDKLHAIGANRVTVFLDACHAGGAGAIKGASDPDGETLGISSKSIDMLSAGVGRAIIASSRLTETSLILPGARNSAFTTALLEGLNGAADFYGEGVVKLFSLFEYVADRVPAITADHQHPILRTKIEKNFAIALNLGRNAGAKGPGDATTLLDSVRELIVGLYPGGPADRDIWERAGGDLSRLTLGRPGRSVWFEALKLLERGGGGDNISIKKLIAEALNDYPRNEHLLAYS
ncbi:MAG: caspase family protein [Reyranella sp.]|uniref:caspase family protein n=1 Tax=Reyranella sp. TaxID=1929291 RepID=UPI001AC91D9A|nr:caspase family protein [Reyranella sp.]MBN9088862.1 caspase family protein [Reyranella sp.]